MPDPSEDLLQFGAGMSNELQRNAEWYAARMGKITASEMRVITNGGPRGWKSYMARLSNPPSMFDCRNMEWGREHEPAGIAMYELERGCDVELVGFIVHPSVTYVGASVDGLRPDRTIEVKCPSSEKNHLKTVAYGMPDLHYAQVQAQIWVCEKDQADFISYDPRCKDPENILYIQNIPRDDEYISRMERKCAEFWDMFTNFVSTKESDEIPKLF